MARGKIVPRPLIRNYKKPAVYLALLMILFVTYHLGILQEFFSSLHQHEYAGAFAAGIFYSYGMTTPFSIAALMLMAGSIDPFALAGLAAAGATLSNAIMLHSFSRNLGNTIHITQRISFQVPKADSIWQKLGLSGLGGLVLMSPFPDEIATIIFGISRVDIWKLVVLSFIFKFLGVLAIADISVGFHLSG